MPNPQHNLENALELERRRWQASIDVLQRPKIDGLERLFETTFQYRRQLARDVPELLAASALQNLGKKLTTHLKLVAEEAEKERREAAEGVSDALGGAGGALYAALSGTFKRNKIVKKAKTIQAGLDAELSAMELEGRIALNRPASTQINIGNLNLGTVIGDLNSTINTLSAGGHGDLAGAIQQLSEAISANSTLGNKKELLENLSFVSEQAALPPAKRKTSPIKAAWNAIEAGVGPVSSLIGLAEKVEVVLRGIGVLS